MSNKRPITSFRCTEPAERVDLLLRWGPLSSDRKRVEWFADLMQKGIEFPPVKIVWGSDGRFSVQDGHTRTAASVLAGYSHIPALVNANQGWREANNK